MIIKVILNPIIILNFISQGFILKITTLIFLDLLLFNMRKVELGKTKKQILQKPVKVEV